MGGLLVNKGEALVSFEIVINRVKGNAESTC